MDIANKNSIDGWELLTYANRYIGNVIPPGNIFDTIESIDPINTVNTVHDIETIDTVDTMYDIDAMDTHKNLKYKPDESDHYEDCFSDPELSDKNSVADSEDFEVNSDNEWVNV